MKTRNHKVIRMLCRTWSFLVECVSEFFISTAILLLIVNLICAEIKAWGGCRSVCLLFVSTFLLTLILLSHAIIPNKCVAAGFRRWRVVFALFCLGAWLYASGGAVSVSKVPMTTADGSYCYGTRVRIINPLHYTIEFKRKATSRTNLCDPSKAPVCPSGEGNNRED